ncbi:hypothetical protein FKM82_003999 [Ascaphus truei]
MKGQIAEGLYFNSTEVIIRLIHYDPDENRSDPGPQVVASAQYVLPYPIRANHIAPGSEYSKHTTDSEDSSDYEDVAIEQGACTDQDLDVTLNDDTGTPLASIFNQFCTKISPMLPLPRSLAIRSCP